VNRSVVSHVLAEWAFRLRVAALVEITFERHLRIRRHKNIVGEALYDRHRLAAETNHGSRWCASCSPHHHVLHIDAVDRLIEILAGALKTSAPVLGVAEHPYPARFLVAPAQRVDDHLMRVNEARHALLYLSQNDLGRRKDKKARRLACELQHPVLGGLAEFCDGGIESTPALFSCHDQGDLAGARRFHERSLAIREKLLGAEHPDTATNLNNLALLLRAQGDLAGARPLCERAVAIFEKMLGPEHPNTAQSLNNLALLLQDQGDLVGARPLCERALAIRENVLGAEHPSVAQSLNNLALLLQAKGDLAGARRLYERSLSIYEKALGPEHPDKALSLSNLATVLQAQGDLGGARPLFERALAISEKVLGPEHPDTATRASSLARLLRDTGHALAIHEVTPGPNHPWTKDSARVTANALDALGRTEEAKVLRERYGLAALENPKSP
jgi:tetratricopeptide (TPR) repeat protein